MRVVFYTLVGVFVLTACEGTNPHHGLYNALFYDYDARLKKIDENLSAQKIEENRLKIEKTKISKVEIEKKEKVTRLEESLKELNAEVKEMHNRLNSIALNKKLSEIKRIVLSIKDEINKKELIQKYHAQQNRRLNDNIEEVLVTIENRDQEKIVTLVGQTMLEVEKYIE